ncbi:hypothetical protein CYMTET_28097 [Cymbomonas tetramitiformis]|uniref:30S ribosomal protein S16, chloroplastic n=1 Tax=Cymbomonas tetramitiformis TaxID=36881 RepID=A0AAE0FNG1_9CHLO|nr:hypothetical protein CYMTET_28097 [Cymbomonas tetramitiformis]
MSQMLTSSFVTPKGAVGFSTSVSSNANLRASAPFKAQKVDTTVTAVVKIRFTRMGRNKSPFYRIVAIDSRKRRDGRPLQNLGWYNPLKKETQLDAPAIKDWLEKGCAFPSANTFFVVWTRRPTPLALGDAGCVHSYKGKSVCKAAYTSVTVGLQM